MNNPPKQDSNRGSDHPLQLAVVGIGGCGCKIIDKTVERYKDYITFFVIDTDQRNISDSKASTKIWAGESTYPHGTGARMEVGKEALEEKRKEIQQALSGFNVAILAGGMGGGTGTGGCQVVAKVTSSLEIPTVAVVTSPFKFEGRRRNKVAEDGIKILRGMVDRLIIVPIERVRYMSENLNLIQAFEKADELAATTISTVVQQIRSKGRDNIDLDTIDTDY